jgi:hypothetical protein
MCNVVPRTTNFNHRHRHRRPHPLMFGPSPVHPLERLSAGLGGQVEISPFVA